MKYTLPLPPPINQTYKSAYNHKAGHAVFYMSGEAKAWKEEVAYKIKQLKELLTGDIEMDVDWYFGRDRDIDSGEKILQDVFIGRVYKDDKQIITKVVNKIRKSDNPRVEVSIIDLSS